MDVCWLRCAGAEYGTSCDVKNETACSRERRVGEDLPQRWLYRSFGNLVTIYLFTRSSLNGGDQTTRRCSTKRHLMRNTLMVPPEKTNRYIHSILHHPELNFHHGFQEAGTFLTPEGAAYLSARDGCHGTCNRTHQQRWILRVWRKREIDLPRARAGREKHMHRFPFL